MTEPTQKPSKPWWKRWWVIAIGAFILLGIIGNAFSSKDADRKSAQESSTTFPVERTTSTTAESTTTSKPTDQTCYAAFKAYSDAVAAESAARDAYTEQLANGNSSAQEPPIIDEEPLQIGTLNNCAGKVSWIVFAMKFSGNDPGDLFPPGGEDAVRRVYPSFCDGDTRAELPACKNTFS